MVYCLHDIWRNFAGQRAPLCGISGPHSAKAVHAAGRTEDAGQNGYI